MQGIPGQSQLPPPQFFVDHKKGEVNELRQLLKAMALDKDQNKRRDVIKKVIAYMTLGIDVSRLYPEMVKASRTDDIVMKKMIYLYLINYAEQNQDIAIMAINTFLMDLKQSNHKIRGLALRSISSLRFDGVTAYLLQAIQDGLNDVDPYVKKTAITGCIKLYHQSKDEFKKTEFLDQLYKLTRDSDSLVVINAIEAINEIRADKGGIEISRSLVINLLNRIKEFNEWGQSMILELTSKYQPQTKEEMFDIMNILEDRFKHASSSVVLGAVKVFLNLTRNDENLSKQVYERLQQPLITLMTSSETTESYEVSFNVLSHIYLLSIKGANNVFDSEFKHFFIKYDEPSYIKYLKLDILSYIASPSNIQEIVSELSEYVTDVNADIAKKSIQCFGTIILRLPQMSKTVVTQLRNFLGMRITYITTETIIALKDILRKYRSYIEDFLPFFSKIDPETLTEVEGKIAYVWVIGEFGELIDEAPYILEKMVEEQKDFNSVNLQAILLVSLCKIFFKRAPEIQKILGLMIEYIIKQSLDTELKQKAIFYYRVLKECHIDIAKQIIIGETNQITDFYEYKNEEANEQLLNEFNTLSVVYQKPSNRFLRDQQLKQAQALEEKYYSHLKNKPIKIAGQYESENQVENNDIQAITDDKKEIQNLQPSLDDLLNFEDAQQKKPEQQNMIDLGENQQKNLLDEQFLLESSNKLDDLNSVQFNPLKQEVLEINQISDLSSDKFQQLWMSLNEQGKIQKLCKMDIQLNLNEIQQCLAKSYIFCMANGQIGNELKFFFHSQSKDQNQYFLVECLINQQSKAFSANFKCTKSDQYEQYQQYFVQAFSTYLLTT